MPWPKGVKRVGYVKKDGTPHAKRGQGTRLAPRIKTDTDPRPKVQVIAKPEPAMTVTKTVPVKNIGGKPVVEPCPNCGHAYADGGYCSECGWTRFDPHCPHCRKGK